MAASKRSGCYAALIFLDLDNFKPLNDTHGHAVGDALLVEVAIRLLSCVREVDTVARFGGDEFVVMLGELNTDLSEAASEALVVAEKVLASLSTPYFLTISQKGVPDTTIEHRCSASIGVAVFIDHEGTPNDIIKWADSAMYQAKESGRSQIKFYQQQV
ncbi:MAG: GGDEF domain-containing protein [Fimbriimonadaceae bacterium]